MPAPTERQRALRRRLLAAGLLAAVATAVLLWTARGELRGFATAGIEWLREAGPVAFFAGMALLPAVGFPLLPFALAAGPVFGPTLGPAAVAACAFGAVAVNVTLSYGLAARGLRPVVLWLCGRLGYRLPELPAGSAWQVVWLVRLTPGLPFWVQSYLLGLAQVPFRPYLVVSVLLPGAYITATILGGDALMRGHNRGALIALAALGFCAAAVHLLRKGQARKRAATAASAGRSSVES